MSEPTNPPIAPKPPAPSEPSTPPGDKPLGENGEKALKAERDARAAAEKANAALQKRLDEIEAANLSDLERAQKQAADAQASAAKGITEAFREAAVAFGGISAEDAELFLTGTDKETLTRQAARLAERTPVSSTEPGKAPAPRPDLSQGGKGGSGERTSGEKFADFLAQTLNT